MSISEISFIIIMTITVYLLGIFTTLIVQYITKEEERLSKND